MARSVPRALTPAARAHRAAFCTEEQPSSPDSRPAIRLVTASSSPPASPSPFTTPSDSREPAHRRRSTSVSAPEGLARASSLNLSNGSASTLRPVLRGSERTIQHRRSSSQALSAAFVWSRADSTSGLAHETDTSPSAATPEDELSISLAVSAEDVQPRKLKKTQSFDVLRRASILFHPASSTSTPAVRDTPQNPPTTVTPRAKTRNTAHKDRASGKRKAVGLRGWIDETARKAKGGWGKLVRAGGDGMKRGEAVVEKAEGVDDQADGWENEEEEEEEKDKCVESPTTVTTSKKRPRTSGASTIKQRGSLSGGGRICSPISPSMRGRSGKSGASPFALPSVTHLRVLHTTEPSIPFFAGNLASSASRHSTIRREPLPSSSPSTHSFRFVATSARKRQRIKRSSLSTSTTSYSRFVEIPKREGSVLHRPRPVKKSELLRISTTSLRSSVGPSTTDEGRRSRVVSFASPSTRIEEATSDVDEHDPLKGLFCHSDDEVRPLPFSMPLKALRLTLAVVCWQVFPVTGVDGASLASPLKRARFVRSAAPSPASSKATSHISATPASSRIETSMSRGHVTLERTKATRRSRRSKTVSPFSTIDVSKDSKSSSSAHYSRRSRHIEAAEPAQVDLASSTSTIDELRRVVDAEIERSSRRSGEYNGESEAEWTSADELEEVGQGGANFIGQRHLVTPSVSRHGDAGSMTQSDVGSPFKDAPEDDSLIFTSPTSVDFPVHAYDLDTDSETDVASALVVPARRLSKEVVCKGSLADLAGARLASSSTSATSSDALEPVPESRYQISPIQPISPFKFGSPYKKVGELISVHEEKVRLSTGTGAWSPRAAYFDTSFQSSSSAASPPHSLERSSSSPTIRTYSSPTPDPCNSPTALTLSPSTTLNAALLKKAAAMVFATPPAAKGASESDGLKRTVRPGSPASKARAGGLEGEKRDWAIYEDEESAAEEDGKQREVVGSGLRQAEKDSKSLAAAPRTPFADQKNLAGGTR